MMHFHDSARKDVFLHLSFKQIQDYEPKILKVRNTSDYSRYLGQTDTHPLVSVIDFVELSPIRHSLNSYSSVYGMFILPQ